MYVVFARKYRPQRFEDVIGQQHVTRTLQNAVRTDRVAHAYLFCGSRGIGKTTVARILAKALNCEQGPTPKPCCECDACRRIAAGNDIDVLEIDGASNRGIDNVRELRQNAGLSPARSRFKVYYIDEVHMLTTEAFNALLKTLEEPPPHVKFIFSTTDPQRVPETVRSRCQRFDFRRISDAELVNALRGVCENEGLQVEQGGLPAIARAARGSMRDALGALDQLAAFGDHVRMPDVLAVLGAVDTRVLTRLIDAVAEEDPAAALEVLDEALSGGTSIEDFTRQTAEYVRDLLVASCAGADAPLLAGSAAGAETLTRQSGAFSEDQLTYMIQLLREAALRARRESTGRIALELAVIRMCRMADLVPLAEALGAVREGTGTPSPSGPAREQQASSPSGSGATTGALRRMREKLSNNKGNAEAAPAPRHDLPEGMDEVKYRQLLAVADDPEEVKEALEDKPLMQAFLKAEETLGLNPQRLEKLSPETEESEDDESLGEDGLRPQQE